MVRKGSSVRVRQRAFPKSPLIRTLRHPDSGVDRRVAEHLRNTVCCRERRTRAPAASSLGARNSCGAVQSAADAPHNRRLSGSLASDASARWSEPPRPSRGRSRRRRSVSASEAHCRVRSRDLRAALTTTAGPTADEATSRTGAEPRPRLRRPRRSQPTQASTSPASNGAVRQFVRGRGGGLRRVQAEVRTGVGTRG
jgi:hypothetical protein